MLIIQRITKQLETKEDTMKATIKWDNYIPYRTDNIDQRKLERNKSKIKALKLLIKDYEEENLKLKRYEK